MRHLESVAMLLIPAATVVAIAVTSMVGSGGSSIKPLEPLIDNTIFLRTLQARELEQNRELERERKAALEHIPNNLVWPVVGTVSAYMGPTHPLGIDIDLSNNPNSPVKVVAGGLVTFAGGDPCCSYGYHVVIYHGNDVETLYAHLSSIAVVTGQEVFKGEIIGNAGCTGYCTGAHLHFEVIAGGRHLNPLDYLP